MSEEQPHEEQREDQHPIPLTQTLGYGAGTFLTVGVIDLLAHWGPTGLVIGCILAYVAAKHGPELTSQVREALPSPPAGQPEIEEPRQRRKRSFMDRALGRHPEGKPAAAEATADDTVVVPEEEIEGADPRPEEDAAFTHPAEQIEVPGVPRLTIEQIVSHTERNRYDIISALDDQAEPSSGADQFLQTPLKTAWRKPAWQDQYGHGALRVYPAHP